MKAMNPSIMRTDVVGTRASSTNRSHSTRGVLLPKPMKSLPSAHSSSRSFSSSASAAVAAAIFLRNNGGKEAVATKKKTAAKKKLACYCSPPPLGLRCPLHQFGSWPFRMLAAAPTRDSPAAAAAGCGDNPLKKKAVVLPIVTRSNPSPFEGYLRRKLQTKKPSSFFFEHEARVVLQTSDAAGSE